MLSECEKIFESLKHVIICYYCCFNLLCYNYILDYVAHVEKETRGQSTKKSQFTFHSGRLTASVIKSAARTNHAMPSPSLVERICYPEVSRHYPSCLKIRKT